MLVESLKKISFTKTDQFGPSSQKNASRRAWPLCVPESAYSEYIVHKVDPVMTGPRYGNVAVRFIIGERTARTRDPGFPGQVKSVADALAK